MTLLGTTMRMANTLVVGLGSVAMAMLPLIVFYDVCARFFFNAPTIWASEVSVYLLQLLVFLPMGLLLSENEHIRSTLLTDNLSAKQQRVLHLFSLILVAILAACISWLGWIMTVYAWEHSQVSATLLAVPLWLPRALIPIGGALLFLNSIVSLFSRPAHGRNS